ncbi:hypothetical protein QBC42DRAFT_227951 [Cladorrhinum samala]|uniref:Kinetochore protein mis14 n=1 Tax=Cladorrhinum samala TaxID=585594 RepID=A0AAV9HL56_9PEZI|nr:hypothetical protein QBC42DRAFT_227951 [Cladorrhinum samala]
MDEAAAQRRIELQSPEDLTYLINNVRKAALDSINAAFPPVEIDGDAPPEEDELRNQIEKLVNDYITKTFTLALPSLTINGLPLKTLPPQSRSPSSPSASGKSSSHHHQQNQPPEPEIQYEPFDPRKRDRIEQLVSEEEDLLRSIAQLKRKVPQATAPKWLEGTRAGMRSDEEAAEQLVQRVKDEGQESGRRALEGMGPLERQESVEESFRAAVEGLARLKRDMPASVAKMERARVAGSYVRGKK